MGGVEMVAELKDTLPDDVAKMVERLRKAGNPWYSHTCESAADMIERLARQVPEGCVVVPREPTEAIRKAGCVYLDDDLFIADGIYKAMIAAGEVK
jgi:hypothetical protein